MEEVVQKYFKCHMNLGALPFIKLDVQNAVKQIYPFNNYPTSYWPRLQAEQHDEAVNYRCYFLHDCHN